MLKIEYEEGVKADDRYRKAILNGVELAKAQGYEVEDLTFIIKNPTKRYPDGASAGILEGDRLIGLAVDEHSPNFDLLVPLTVHEINHLEREKHSSIFTLEEVLVSEGLAQMAEVKTGLSKITAAYFKSPEEREIAIKLMADKLDRPLFGKQQDPEQSYDYFFFGDKGGMPDRAGYALGLGIVKSFMEATGDTIQQTTKRPSSEIIEYWKNNKGPSL